MIHYVGTKVAGVELDHLIAIHVMKLKLPTEQEMKAEAEEVWKTQPSCRVFMLGFIARELKDGTFKFIPKVSTYSTRIEDAFEVQKKAGLVVGPNWPEGWRAHNHWSWDVANVKVVAETAPLAICLAALEAGLPIDRSL